MRVMDFTQGHWLEKAETFPLGFSQVREDSQIDVWLARQLPPKSKGIIIGSGGCTAAHLASTNIFSHLTLVDINPAQLDLAKLKIFLLENATQSERMELLGYTNLSAPERKERLLTLLEANAIDKNTFGDIDVVASIGLDYSGRYEMLFAALQEKLQDVPGHETLFQLDCPKEQKLFLGENPDYVMALKKAFTEVMDLNNLVRLFGKEATQNAIKPFSQHFFERTIIAIETLPAASNPYLAQFLKGKFYSKEYAWLSLPKQGLKTEFQFMKSTMFEALTNSSSEYDFIHLSNILDWLDVHEATQVLHEASKKLTPGGKLILRQLNSTLEIPSLCSHLCWQPEIASKLHREDRSFFYNKIHIGISYGNY